MKPWIRQIGAFLLTAALACPAFAQGQSQSGQQQSPPQSQQQTPPQSQQQTQPAEPQSQQQQPPPDIVPDSGQTQQADVPSEAGAKRMSTPSATAKWAMGQTSTRWSMRSHWASSWRRKWIAFRNSSLIRW